MIQNYLKMDKKDIYLTEAFSKLKVGKRIEANSFQEAENKCPYGYRVIGRFICEIDSPEFDNLNLN